MIGLALADQRDQLNMKNLLTTLILGLTVMVGLSCSSSESGSTPKDTATPQAQVPAQTATPSVSKSPAALAVARFSTIDTEMKTHQLSEWVGKTPVVINFWGTWCPPCRREIPGLVRLYDEYKDRGVEIVSLAIERRAGPAEVKRFTDQAGMKWVQLMASEDILKAFRYTGSVPTTIFLDQNGNETARYVGARDYNTFKRDFEKLAAGI